jgi:hypothetical protein
LTVKPVDQIPPPKSRIKARPEYDEIRELLRVAHPRVACIIADGLTENVARRMREALNQGDYFACTRSVGLPEGVKPHAVYGGWCLSAEEIAKAKGLERAEEAE